jgi:hypothetical protein
MLSTSSNLHSPQNLFQIPWHDVVFHYTYHLKIKKDEEKNTLMSRCNMVPVRFMVGKEAQAHGCRELVLLST